MYHHRSPQDPAVAGVAVDERGSLRRHHEDLANERVGHTVAVAVHVEQGLGENVVGSRGEQVEQTIRGGARRTIHPGLILKGQDDAGPGWLEQLAERLAEHARVRGGVTRAAVDAARAGRLTEPGVGVADDAGIFHHRRQNRLGVLPPGSDRHPAGLIEQRPHRHHLDGPCEG